jgi:thiamine biosynthesis lipoprotein
MADIEFHAMGCQMLAILDAPNPAAQRHLRRVPQWFEVWEDHLSRFRPESELSRLNRSNGQMVSVSPTLWSVFQASRQAEALSGGLVTPTVLDAMLASGYDASFETLANGVQAKAARLAGSLPTTEKIRYDLDHRSIQLPAGIGLDFGGVAKGWSAQQAVGRLQAYGPCLVDASGDIAISGLRAGGQPWQIGVADPLHPDRDLAELMLGRCGVATSGRDRRRWQQDGVWRHHIIDPRTGMPAETDVLSATVIAPDLIWAEIAAKTAFILGSHAGLAWIEERPALAAILVLEDGRSLFSARMEGYLWKEKLRP